MLQTVFSDFNRASSHLQEEHRLSTSFALKYEKSITDFSKRFCKGESTPSSRSVLFR